MAVNEIPESVFQAAAEVLRQVDPSAFVVWPRVVRRVILEDRQLTGLSWNVPHRKCYFISRDKLLEFVALDELGVTIASALPEQIILIARPDADDVPAPTQPEVFRYLWRILFHARIHVELDRRLADGRLTLALVRERIHRIGQGEFDEIHAVLRRENLLLPPDSKAAVYIEFAALFSELRAFSPEWLESYFPSLGNPDIIAEILGLDLDAGDLLRKTRLPGAVEAAIPLHDQRPASGKSVSVATSAPYPLPGSRPAEVLLQRLQRRAHHAREQGNTVRASVYLTRMLPHATPNERDELLLQRETEVARLVARLQAALQFADGDIPIWSRCLTALHDGASRGFWNHDARLLHDLQSVCIDHERQVSVVDLWGWLKTFGRQPLKRPLPNQREVLMSKHLLSATVRLPKTSLNEELREELKDLLKHAAHLAENQLRQRLRPILSEALRRVDLTPRNVPEEVSRRKIIEEISDRIVKKGYLTMGALRDTLSANNLKLRDLTTPKQFWQGDQLLQCDRELETLLDGVYYRGEFYLRWLQRLSSLAFGTYWGQRITQYVAIPFGASLVILEGLDHLAHVVIGAFTPEHPEESQHTTAENHPTDHTDHHSAEHPGEATENQTTEHPTTPMTVADAGSDSAGSPPAEDQTTDAQPQVAQAEAQSPAEDQTEAVTSDSTAEPHDEHAADATTAHTAEAETVAHVAVDSHAHAHHPKIFMSYPSFFGLGFFLLFLLHERIFRKAIGEILKLTWKAVRTLLYDLPVGIVQLPPVQKLLNSPPVVLFRRIVLLPLVLAIGAGLCLLLTDLSWNGWWTSVGVIFAGLLIALNSRLGRDLEEVSAEWLVRLLHRIGVRFMLALFEFIMETFKQILEVIERLLYAVDEWLRYKSGESDLTLGIKAVLGMAWSMVTFVIRFAVTLLIEPQVNPIKHFPVVTVSHKIILPTQPLIAQLMMTWADRWTANAIAATIVFLLPGVFGFLVWELRENWRLFASNRPRKLLPVVIGSHGETLIRLIKPGFHSGTLPKLYSKLRRAERKGHLPRWRNTKAVLHEKLDHVAEEIKHFFERELLRLLEESRGWGSFPLRVGEIETASNRMRIELQALDAPTDPLWLVFEEQSGWLVAGIHRQGWLKLLTPAQHKVLRLALTGIYKIGGVDLIREQIESKFATRQHPYDISQRGLVVWPTPEYDVEIYYSLHDRRLLIARPRKLAREHQLHDLDAREILFSQNPIASRRWVEAWDAEANGTPLPVLFPDEQRILPDPNELLLGSPGIS